MNMKCLSQPNRAPRKSGEPGAGTRPDTGPQASPLSRATLDTEVQTHRKHMHKQASLSPGSPALG